MKKKVISLLLCCTLIMQPGISVYGEELLYSGEEAVSEESLESNTALDDGEAEVLIPEKQPEGETLEQIEAGQTAECVLEDPVEDIGSEGIGEKNTEDENTASGQCEKMFSGHWTKMGF